MVWNDVNKRINNLYEGTINYTFYLILSTCFIFGHNGQNPAVLILGDWHSNEIDSDGNDNVNQNYTFIFSANQTCSQSGTGGDTIHYTWVIEHEMSSSGLEFDFLVLTNAEGNELVFEIDAINATHMALVYLSGVGPERNYFIR